MRPLTDLRTPILIVVLAGCAQVATPDPAAIRKSLDSSLVSHAQHFREANIDGLVAQYAENAVVRPAGMDAIRGRAALRTTLAAWIAAAPIKALEYTSEDLAVFGDSAFQIVSYSATAQPPGSVEAVDRGSCALLWVRDAGAVWRIERSLCNSSVPPSQQVSRTAQTR